MSAATNHLDKLLGLTKPLEQYTTQELTLALAKHFPVTRATRDIDSFLNNPLLAHLTEEQKEAIKNPSPLSLRL